MKIFKRSTLCWIIILILISGCTQVVTAPIDVAGSVVGATIDVAGATANAVTDSEEEEN